MSVSRVVIVGATGQLGSALLASVPSTVEAVPLTSAQLDLTDPDSVTSGLSGLRAGDVVINTAAYTAVDAAEADADRAYAVNADGPRYLATATAAAGARLIQVSTDYVFADSDTPRDRPLEPGDLMTGTKPATVYGATKLAGERAACEADPSSIIVRTAWVFTGAAGAPDFVGTMRRLEAERDTVSVVDDQRGSPTFAPDLAAGLWEVATRPELSGTVLHAVNAGEATWFDLARAVFAGIGADEQRVQPCTTADFPRPAPRPAYSVLSSESWLQAGLTPLRSWRDALADALTR